MIGEAKFSAESENISDHFSLLNGATDLTEPTALPAVPSVAAEAADRQ